MLLKFMAAYFEHLPDSVQAGTKAQVLVVRGFALLCTFQRPGTDSELRDVTQGAGAFVIVGAGGTILSSTDTVNWTKRTSGTQELLLGVGYGNSSFVAAGTGGTILTSTNDPSIGGSGLQSPAASADCTCLGRRGRICVRAERGGSAQLSHRAVRPPSNLEHLDQLRQHGSLHSTS